MLESLITNFPVFAIESKAKETEQMAFFEKPRSEYLSRIR